MNYHYYYTRRLQSQDRHRKCQCCDEDFIAVPRHKKYCSEECKKAFSDARQWANYIPRKVERPCRVCGTMSMRIDCSSRCRARSVNKRQIVARNKRRRQKVCSECGKKFKTKTSGICCSRRCSRARQKKINQTWRITHSEQVNQRRRILRRSPEAMERQRLSQAKWAKRNPEKLRARWRRSHLNLKGTLKYRIKKQRARDSARDRCSRSYIAHLVGIPATNLPEAFVGAYRVALQLKRHLGMTPNYDK